jgi:hypothetical protein
MNIKPIAIHPQITQAVLLSEGLPVTLSRAGMSNASRPRPVAATIDLGNSNEQVFAVLKSIRAVSQKANDGKAQYVGARGGDVIAIKHGGAGYRVTQGDDNYFYIPPNGDERAHGMHGKLAVEGGHTVSLREGLKLVQDDQGKLKITNRDLPLSKLFN